MYSCQKGKRGSTRNGNRRRSAKRKVSTAAVDLETPNLDFGRASAKNLDLTVLGIEIGQNWYDFCVQIFERALSDAAKTAGMLQKSTRKDLDKEDMNLEGHNCNMKMYEETKVTCKLSSFDPSFKNVIVEKLQTPVPPVLDRAILRVHDIISMEFVLPSD